MAKRKKKPPKQEPRWRLLERVAGLIEKTLDPSAHVEHNVNLPDLTNPGFERQCDVVVTRGPSHRYSGGPIRANADGRENLREGTPTGEHVHLLRDIFGGLIEAGFTIEQVLDGPRHLAGPGAVPGSHDHQVGTVAEYFAVVCRKGAYRAERHLRRSPVRAGGKQRRPVGRDFTATRTRELRSGARERLELIADIAEP